MITILSNPNGSMQIEIANDVMKLLSKNVTLIKFRAKLVDLAVEHNKFE